MALALSVVSMSGCEEVRSALRNQPVGDPRWQGDSTLLAAKPEFLFRVKREGEKVRVVPLTTVGALGFRSLYFSERGWRAFDLQYLQQGSRLTAYREGRPVGTVEMAHGMWDTPSAPLDTIPGCGNIIPNGRASIPDGVSLLTSGTRPPLKTVRTLSSGELEAALGTVSTLIAPTSGISGALLPKYRRDVHVIPSGASEWPSILIEFDDPETVHDTIPPIAQRPRNLVVILDRGVYGYRPSYTYSTVGNRQSVPRIYFVDYLDVDDDGHAELFFGVRDLRSPLLAMSTIVLRFENEAWREMLKYEAFPCPG